MRTINKKNIALATIPLLGLGWYLFRPELLFIDQKVAEKSPSPSTPGSMKVADGEFASYSHETSGKAILIDQNGSSTLRLENLKTSNGPDVHVYLVKGMDPRIVKDGEFLDLGTLKGNVGDQNYTIPTGTKLSEYGAVSVWCKRFSVGFGGAQLKSSMKDTASRNSKFISLASFKFTPEEIRVTSGPFSMGAKGSVDLIEKSGKRFIKVSGLRTSEKGNSELYFVKSETLTKDANLDPLTKVKLGKFDPKATSQIFEVSKDLDVWLYRTVAVWNPKLKKLVTVAELRADQERKKTLEII